MVIQQKAPYPIWSKEKLSVTFLGKTYTSKKVNNKWFISLPPAKAGGPYSMEIISENESKKIQDIYIGDVWLCSGQSNMEMMMTRLHDDFNEEWETDSFPVIRQFKVHQEWDFSAPREEIKEGSWVIPSKEKLSEFAATPWFFAKNMYQKYKIPIGLITTAWGGTPIESWMSCEALADYPVKIADGRRNASPEKREEIVKTSETAIVHWETNLRHDDIGVKEDWKNNETDISAWNEITLPGNFADAGLKNFCGIIWLAKDFNVSKDFASQDAKTWLGTIIDSDTVFINGIEIGTTGYRYPPRKYSCENHLKEGKNRIVIRVTCVNGDGGITGDKPFHIFTDNEEVELKGAWKYKVGATTTKRPSEYFFQRQPMGNFNAMIAPVLKYPFKGVIWYQGESNESSPFEYLKLFKSMINDWRKKNRNKKLPFLFVQLPIFCSETENDENHNWAILREAQAGALCLPKTGMACALELGEWNDIHPINKKDVGYRLFLAAEKVVYGEKNSSPGPVLKKHIIKQNKIYLHFKNCAKGLKETKPAYVTVVTSEGNIKLPAKIESPDTLSIDISSVNYPKKILYAWANNPKDRQLFNSDGLPMLPFKIELK